MKQKFIYTLSVAAALLATACTDDMGVQDMPVESGKGYTMTVGASMTPASRMAIENDGEVVNYYWTADDAFTVFDLRNNQQTEFVIDSDSLTATSTKADFIGTPEKAYIEGQKLYAVYNKKEQVQLDANGNVNFDLSNQNGQLTEDFQYMWGDATYKDGKPLEFVFRHLVTTLQVKMAVPDGVETLSNVTLYSPNLVSKATLVLNEAPYDTERQFGVGDLVYSYNESGSFEFGSITLDGEFTPVDGYVTFYIYTLSAKQYHESSTWYNQAVRPTILFTDETGIQHVSTDVFDNKEMEVGAVYSLGIENFIPLVDFENEAIAWGSENEPYQIANADQMFSLMMRSYLRMSDRNGNQYINRSYQLTDDIVLDTRSLWYPIYIHYGDFDGNGKTISGELNMYVGAEGGVGLFGYFWGGTLKDLTFDADITQVYKTGWTRHTPTGTLVGELMFSTVDRCFSSARMNGEGVIAGDLGGLIGTAGISTIEYCGFSGDIDTDSWHDSVGGLIGSNNSWSDSRSLIINGCYSDGSITIGHDCNCFGGIIGNVSAPNVTISNCWTAASLVSTKYPESPASEMGGIIGSYGRGDAGLKIINNYWNNAIGACIGYGDSITPVDCASFEGSIPTEEQLKNLNYEILSSGLMFSMENGHLVKNTQTGVPPSDIENW